MDLAAPPALAAAVGGVDEGVVDHIVFGVSAGLAAAPMFPNTFELPPPNTVGPAPEPVFEPNGEGEVPCIPLPNPVDAELVAPPFD